MGSRRLARRAVLSVLLAFGPAAGAVASPYDLGYGGRLTDGGGAPLAGPVDVTVRFFRSATTGDDVDGVRALTFRKVALKDGVFQLTLSLTPAEMRLLFDGASETWVEVAAAGKTYPRQRLSAVPYALAVPVDGETVSFNASGQLTVGPETAPGANQFLTKDSHGSLVWGTPSTDATQIAGATVATGTPSAGAVLKYVGGQWQAVPDTGVNRGGDTMAGFLGIGTTSAQTALDVAGALTQRGAAAPGVAPAGEGRIYFDTTSNQFMVSQNGGAYAPLGTVTGGVITQVSAGGGLTGGGTTGNVTVAMPSVGTAGTYTKVLTDAYGRVTGGTSLAAGDVPALDASKITSGQVAAARIPALDAGVITTGTLATSRVPSLDAAQIGTGTFATARVPLLDAAQVASGTFATARIPLLDAAQVSTGTFATARIPLIDAAHVSTGTFATARIPLLDAAQVASGTLATARIPLLDASQVTTGTFAAARIPLLDASKLDPTSSPTFANLALTGPAAGNLLKVGAGGTLAVATASDVTGLVGTAYVTKTGDTMSGALRLPTDGLVVGTSELVTAGGLVGVGTTSPGAGLTTAYTRLLEVYDPSGSGYSGLSLAGSSSNVGVGGPFGGVSFRNGSNALGVEAVKIVAYRDAGASNYGGALGFWTSVSGVATGAQALTINSGGNVGIGTTTPAYALDVNGTVHASAFLTGSGTANWSNESLTNIQQLSIGTTAAGADLLFGASANRTILVQQGTTAGSSLTVGAGGTTGANQSGGNLILASGTSNGTGSSSILLQTSNGGAPATSMTILGNGNVGIGTVSPTSLLSVGAAGQLQVGTTGNVSWASSASPTLSLLAPTTDAVTNTLSLLGQDANASATTHQEGGGVLIAAGRYAGNAWTTTGSIDLRAGSSLTGGPTPGIRVKTNGYMGDAMLESYGGGSSVGLTVPSGGVVALGYGTGSGGGFQASSNDFENSSMLKIVNSGTSYRILPGNLWSLSVKSGSGNAGTADVPSQSGQTLTLQGGDAPTSSYATLPGLAGNGGATVVTAGKGGLSQNSSTQGNGGNVYVLGGGLPASGAGGTAGNVILAHTGTAARGLVGIGTASPAYLLDVAGTVRASSFLSTGASNFGNQNVTNMQGLSIGTASTPGTDQILFGTGAAASLLVQSATSGAGQSLTIQAGGTSGAGQSGGNLVLASGTSNGGSSSISFQTSNGGAPVTSMTILGNGNVGIGTTSPGRLLSIQLASGNQAGQGLGIAGQGGSGGIQLINGTSAADKFMPTVNGISSYNAANVPGLLLQGTPAADVVDEPGVVVRATSPTTGLQTTTAPVLQVQNYATPLLTVDHSGNVGIGTTTPFQQLTVANDVQSRRLFVGWGGDSSLYGSQSTTNAGDGIGVMNGAGVYFTPAGSYLYPWKAYADATRSLSFQAASSASPKTLNIQQGTGGGLLTTTIEGRTVHHPLADITQAFQVQNAAGTSLFDVDSTTGNVGIGTGTPNYTLHVVANTSNDVGAYLRNTSSTGYGLKIQNGQDTNYALGIVNAASSLVPIQLYGNGTAYLAVGSGSVGIGTNSPQGILQTAGGDVYMGDEGNFARSIRWRRNGATLGGLTSTNGVFSLYGGATPANHLTIDSSGNVAIGTTVPQTLLQVQKTDQSTASTSFSTLLQTYVDPTATSSATVYGSYLHTQTLASNSQTIAGGIYGAFGSFEHYATGTLSSGYGVRGSVYNQSSGTITAASGLTSTVYNFGSGTITNAYGLNVVAPQNSGGGTMQSYFGVYVATPTVAQNNYAIYAAGGYNYFGGNVSIGTTSAVSALTVGGTIQSTSGGVKFPDGTVQATAMPARFQACGRLTLTSGVPVTTSDVTNAATLYYTPYTCDLIGLYDGTSTWTVLSFAETSLSLASVVAGNSYDIFAYNNSGTLALELYAWTSATVRATALARVNGIIVKSSDTSRRYLGTIYGSAAGKTEDSVLRRFVWNNYNQVTRKLAVTDTTASWAGTNTSWGAWNGSTANRVEVVIGQPGPVVEMTFVGNAAGSTNCALGIGYDSTSANVADTSQFQIATGNADQMSATLEHYPVMGYHYYQMLQIAGAASGCTYYGKQPSPPTQAGAVGRIVN